MQSDPDSSGVPTPPKRNVGGRPRRADWQEPFLENFSLHGIQVRAAELAKVSKNTVDAERRRNPEFATRFEEAFEQSTGLLEHTAVVLGTSGLPVRKTVTRTDKAGAVTEIVEESVVMYPPMLIFLLKSRRPQVYRESVHVESTGKDGGPIRVESIDVIDAQIAALTAELAKDAAGVPPPVE